MLKYKKIKNSGLARRGQLITAHGMVDLPTFITLLKHGDLGTLWMPNGMRTFSELIWDGPMIDLGQLMFGLDTEFVFEGLHLYTLFTYAFLHADIIHLASNMIALYYYCM